MISFVMETSASAPLDALIEWNNGLIRRKINLQYPGRKILQGIQTLQIKRPDQVNWLFNGLHQFPGVPFHQPPVNSRCMKAYIEWKVQALVDYSDSFVDSSDL